MEKYPLPVITEVEFWTEAKPKWVEKKPLVINEEFTEIVDQKINR